MKSVIFTLLLLVPFCIKGQDVLVQITNPQVSGNQVTYDVTVENFNEIVAYQFEIVYDPSILGFDTIVNINVPDLGFEDGFYANNPGSIVNAWIDPALDGVTLDSGTVMYQIVFNMANDTFGSVCFNKDSTAFEFSQFNGLVPVYITDDCNEEPVLFSEGEVSSTDDLEAVHGLTIYSVVRDQTLSFSLEQERKLGFHIYSLDGALLTSFSNNTYSAGQHGLKIQKNLAPGMYVVSTEINKKAFARRVIIF